MPRRAVIDVDLARRLYDAGQSWDEIGDACGVTPETARRHIDPVYAGKRREQRKLLEQQQGRVVRHRERQPVTPPLPIPLPAAQDTRTWQQRFFGDPSKERSALSMRKANV